MTDTKTNTQPPELTDFIHEVARLNGRLVMAGDRLMSGFGLSSARWKVIGAIQGSGRPQTVSWIARKIGLKRQGVQRIVNELESEGYVRLIDNPDHKRARLLELSPAGAAAFSAVMAEYEIWSQKMQNAIPDGRLQTLLGHMRDMRDLLDSPEMQSQPSHAKIAITANDNDDGADNTSYGATPGTALRLPEIAPWP